MKWKFPISKAVLAKQIQKLKLEPGDIVLVKDLETLHAIEGLGRVVNFTVPLVFAPQGIQVLKRQDLLNLLEQIEQSPAPSSSLESPSAPL